MNCDNCGAELVEYITREYIPGVGYLREYECPNGCPEDQMFDFDAEG